MTSDPITRLKAALEGRYRIERELGEGGMAVVYLAEDLRHERKVALKVLKPELAAVVGAERFLAEIKTTANLQHPHILPLFDSGQAESFLYFVMPYVEGDTLRDKIDREKQLSIEEALKITKKVASALEHAHKNGVVHRDIKPGNILLNPEGEPTVADFGIALAVAQAGGGRVTETGLSVGTPHYMSPEQATGDRDVDPRTDVYALGCVLYEMLVGEPPYTGSNAQAVLARILTGHALAPTEVRPTLPPNVDAAIRKALEKLPADRFGTAQDFAGALGDPGFRHGEEAAVGMAAAAGLWNPLSIVATVLALVSTVGFGWLLFQSDPPAPVTRLVVSIPEAQRFDPTRGDLDLSLDGSLLVYRGVGPEGAQLLARYWNALDATPIRDTEGAVRPAISPDGLEVAFGGGGGIGIRVAPLQGGISRILTEAVWRQGAVQRWSPDGAWIYYSDAAGGISRLPSSGSLGPEIVTQADTTGGERHTYVDVLPGGDALYTAYSADQTPRIQAVDVETGEVSDLTEGRYPRYSPTGHLLFQDAIETTLLVAPFDAEGLELTGAPLPVADGLIPIGSSDLGPNPGSFAVSGTGRLIYRLGVPSEAEMIEPVWVTRSGDTEVVDLGWQFDAGFGRPGSWGWSLSPNGAQAAVSRVVDGNPDIWLKRLPDGPFERLTFDSEPEDSPGWSPDGQFVLYGRGRSPAGAALNFWTSRADGTGVPEQLSSGSQGLLQGRWHPEGEWIVFRNSDIVGFRLGADSIAVPLVATEFSERGPAFSNDGRWLAYSSNETGREEVYVRPFPDVDSGRWQVSIDGGSNPRWSDDGTELFFMDLERSMNVALIETTSVFSVLERRMLFTLGPDFLVSDGGDDFYDVEPGSERFLMGRTAVLPTGGIAAQPDLILVENFFEELRQVAPD